VLGGLGSAGCQPAGRGSLPRPLARRAKKECPTRVHARHVSGKLPETAGWQPALPFACGGAALGKKRCFDVVEKLQTTAPFLADLSPL